MAQELGIKLTPEGLDPLLTGGRRRHWAAM